MVQLVTWVMDQNTVTKDTADHIEGFKDEAVVHYQCIICAEVHC